MPKRDSKLQELRKKLGVEFNKIGWHAIKFPNTVYWLGNRNGVPCYNNLTLAKIALGIAQERTGKHLIIAVFDGADTFVDEVATVCTGQEAVQRLETGARTVPATKKHTRLRGKGKNRTDKDTQE